MEKRYERESDKVEVRLLAVDLDDTLLGEDLSVSPENRRALREVEELGVEVVLASGRVKESMDRYATLLGMDRRRGYMISDNGCTVTRTDTGELLYRRSIETDLAIEAHRMVRDAGFPTEIYRQSAVCTDVDNRWTDRDSALSGLRKEVVSDFEALLSDEGPVKMVIPGDPEKIALLEPRVKKAFAGKLHIFTSKPFFLEILPLGSNKGTALTHLAELLEVPREAVMAIGDAYNDLEMIRWAGYGVAMGNGISAVKEAARYVTRKGHQDDGVAEAIDRFILALQRVPSV